MNDFVSSATGSCCDEQHRVSRKRLEWCPRRAVQRGESGCLRGLSGSFVDLLSPSSRLGKSPECRRHQPYRALAWMGSGAPTGTGGCAVFCCCLMIRVSAFIHLSVPNLENAQSTAGLDLTSIRSARRGRGELGLHDDPNCRAPSDQVHQLHSVANRAVPQPGLASSLTCCPASLTDDILHHTNSLTATPPALSAPLYPHCAEHTWRGQPLAWVSPFRQPY